jgi:uncharacterized membrane protein YagU involved in acid resistance
MSWRILRGALAGLMATLPMSAAMEVGAEQLPSKERYPLPPRLITHRLTRVAGLDGELDEQGTQALTAVAHFSYGATMGAIYSSIVPRRHMGPSTGIVFGLGVWAASYLGALPALGILSPVTDHPARRTALMIAAHVVWGSTMGATLQALESQSEDETQWKTCQRGDSLQYQQLAFLPLAPPLPGHDIDRKPSGSLTKLW